jgi:hypothetical protein
MTTQRRILRSWAQIRSWESSRKMKKGGYGYESVKSGKINILSWIAHLQLYIKFMYLEFNLNNLLKYICYMINLKSLITFFDAARFDPLNHFPIHHYLFFFFSFPFPTSNGFDISRIWGPSPFQVDLRSMLSSSTSNLSIQFLVDYSFAS